LGRSKIDRKSDMRKLLKAILVTVLVAWTNPTLAQTDPHHPGDPAATPPQAASPQATQPPTPMMQNCMGMMQMMHGMQGMMMQMMQDRPMQNEMGHEAPMMQGAQAANPDEVFVEAMILHHRGAIDMATAVLQYGKDEQVRVWANAIIAAQEKEIAEMEDWLNANRR
jgi:uncharacterized protein (DUF305 family)